jgi:hypothetical protein
MMLVGARAGLLHVRWLHCAPGAVQMPQLALQQTCPTLQVLGPHMTLEATLATPHNCCEQLSPGAVQIPQLALQHL